VVATSSILSSLRLADTNSVHANDTIDLTFSDGEEVDTRSRAPQPATRSGVSVRRLVFDLTVETEHCAICSHALGEGSDYMSRMFAFETCGCVRFCLDMFLEAR
jgi:hypothetical protein